jgi:hypothetical protein
MEQLPDYISIAFVLTTLLTLLLFYKATNYSTPVISLLLVWLILQLVISLSGFYTVTEGTPPRFALLILPPILLILGLFISKTGRMFIDRLKLRTLTLLHIVRIPVELTLLMLYLHGFVPEVMTFEGRNFDIICGLTAIPVYYFGFIKHKLNRKILLAWNILCLILLINIVSTAVLSAPFSFQQMAFDQPNIALLYFPFVWLPGFIVPIVLFSHIVAIRKLVINKKEFRN